MDFLADFEKALMWSLSFCSFFVFVIVLFFVKMKEEFLLRSVAILFAANCLPLLIFLLPEKAWPETTSLLFFSGGILASLLLLVVTLVDNFCKDRIKMIHFLILASFLNSVGGAIWLKGLCALTAILIIVAALSVFISLDVIGTKIRKS